MARALLPPLHHDRATLHLRQAADRMARAAVMRELAQAACERSRHLLLDDHDRRLRMRSWMQQPSPVPRA